MLVVCTVFAFLGVGIGVLVCILAKANLFVHGRWPFPIGAACVACGIGLLYLPMFVLRRIVRRHLSRPDQSVGFDGVSGGFFVSVENAATYDSFKILADDTGLLYVDFNSRYVTIDGLCHTFGIRSEDVERLELHANGRSVFLSYLIDQVKLDLVIVAWSLRSDTGRQTLGDLGGLFRRLLGALCPDRCE